MARRKELSAKEKYERQKEQWRNSKRRQKEVKTEEQIEAKRKYDRERMAKLREEKKVKRIGDMNEREQRKMRKYWRERHRVQKQKKQAEENELEDVVDTPPPTPPLQRESSQKKRGRKQVRKEKAKVYRVVKKQSEKIKELEKKLEKYKKRYQRQKEKVKSGLSPSPRKQVKDIVGRENVSPRIRKELFIGLTLRKQIETQVKKVAGTKKKKQLVHKVIGNAVLKKYRVQKYFKHLVPYRTNKLLRKTCSMSEFDYTRAPQKKIRNKLEHILLKFFEDDRVSRMCPGKKDVVVKKRLKKQRRILLDTMSNLYNQFVTETGLKVSRATFFRSRPFWVTFPKMSDRETCACIKHSNMEMLVSALASTKVLKEKTAKDVVKSMVCSTGNKKCMLAACDTCKDKLIEFNEKEDFTVKFFKWVTVKEEIKIKDKKKIVKRTVKSVERKKVSEIKSKFKTEVDLFKKHLFYEKHQSEMLKKKIDNVEAGELVFRIDFSENYVCKFNKEVQSTHFGASKRQISLNTGVRYALADDGKVETTSFASASDNLDHQAHAIWAHMKQAWEKSAQDFPNTKKVHIFSDSPSSQYRNRINMYLLKTMLPQFFPNLKLVTWNYTEAGHGKGPMDGVGGTLKRNADQKVLHGQDITCANDFVAALRSYNIFLYEVLSTDVQRFKSVVADLKIPPIKGIMKVHQITWSKGEKLMMARTLTCFVCKADDICRHYHFSSFVLEGDCSDTSKTKITSKKKLSVDEVYSETEDEDDPEPLQALPDISSSGQLDVLEKYAGDVSGPVDVNKLVSGVHVIVEFNIQKKKILVQPQHFIGICQSGVVNSEIEVMFLKQCTKDNRLFYVNESDLSSVHVVQIKAILPLPIIVPKGNRLYYTFK